MYAVTYFVRGREVSASASSWTRAQEKAAKVAIQAERPFPIVIKDDLGRIIDTIKG